MKVLIDTVEDEFWTDRLPGFPGGNAKFCTACLDNCVFHGFLPPSPSEGCHSVHANAATQSTGLLPPSPRERCHVDHEGCHPRQAKPAPVGAARRRVAIVSLTRPLLSTWPAVCASTPHARRSCRHYAPGGPESRQPVSDPPGHHASAPRGADW